MQEAHLTNINEFFDFMFAKDPETEKLQTVPGLLEAQIDAYPLIY